MVNKVIYKGQSFYPINKSKCLNELCTLRTTDGLCPEIEPCIFQEGRQKTIMANGISYTITGSIIDAPSTTKKESKEDNAIEISIVLVMLSIAAAINVATIYLIVKIIEKIIGG